MIDRLGGGKRRELTAAEKGTRLIARIVFDIDICKGLPERVPATGSRRKSRDHLRSRSGCIPQPCGIGSSSTRLRLRFLLRTRGHHHKHRWTTFQTTLLLQERRYQMSVSQGFSSRRSLLAFHCLLRSTPQQKKIPIFLIDTTVPAKRTRQLTWLSASACYFWPLLSLSPPLGWSVTGPIR